MQCPICAVELKMAERQGVEIDYCPQCRGVWLDRGELDKVIERSMIPDRSTAPYGERTGALFRPELRHRDDDHDRDEHHGYEGKKRKRGSFLEEIFDF